jgi:hypothetical protein
MLLDGFIPLCARAECERLALTVFITGGSQCSNANQRAVSTSGFGHFLIYGTKANIYLGETITHILIYILNILICSIKRHIIQ